MVLRTFDGFHYIYWVGPFLGSLVAVIFYKIIKVLEYETANPGQDQDEKEARKYRPQTEPAPNSFDPPGVERVNSSYNQHRRSDKRLQGASHSRNNPNYSKNKNDDDHVGTNSRQQYYNGPRAERGEMVHSLS